MNKKVSIIIPVFNEEDNLDELLKEVNKASFCGLEKEIIIVNDGSTDNSLDICKKYPHKILTHEKNIGKGAAIKTGLKDATGDIIAIQDADLEYSIEDYENIIKKIVNNECQACSNSRFLQKSDAYKFLPMQFIGNKFITLVTNKLYNSNLTDVTTGYKAFSKEVISEIELQSNGFEIEAEIISKLLSNGVEIKEIPAIKYQARNRACGKKLKITDGIRIIYTLIRFRFFQ